ncbi:hypothetical protein GTO91_07080 [Heliobacterium undosum]|uniref:Flagellar protein FlgN n=1 Tax=Heliomicrobium undosum TaxID=121734 RepID=A0A845KZH4_9FIRM|nr:hypothetical protein [Heliomicrobium undosum]MZP29467.1 hypothetical protein [Heliomicrobium undosum]
MSKALLSHAAREMCDLAEVLEKVSEEMAARVVDPSFEDMEWLQERLEQREQLLAQLKDLKRLRVKVNADCASPVVLSQRERPAPPQAADDVSPAEDLEALFAQRIRRVSQLDGVIMQHLFQLKGRWSSEYRRMMNPQNTNQYSQVSDEGPKLYDHQG